ncbi:MAG TPA: DUF3305 domain-containing protein [Acetobacteraceae bacterium]|jgi:hypothetical protein|nr:DUF3305 domain-containing protein [Acetobacteraceae bacterium]
MSLHNPASLFIPATAVVERRPATSRWADHVWRAVEVLEGVPDLAPWTVLREEEGRTLFLAGQAEVALHPTDTDNYKHNIESARPTVWVVLRPAAGEPGFALHTITVDAGEAHLYADAGNDLLEALPMPAFLLPQVTAFVAEHHKDRMFHKRKRDRANPEALGRRGPGEDEA